MIFWPIDGTVIGTFVESILLSVRSGRPYSDWNVCKRSDRYTLLPHLGRPCDPPFTFLAGPSSPLSRVSTIRQMLSTLESRKEDKCRHTEARRDARVISAVGYRLPLTSYFHALHSSLRRNGNWCMHTRWSHGKRDDLAIYLIKLIGLESGDKVGKYTVHGSVWNCGFQIIYSFFFIYNMIIGYGQQSSYSTNNEKLNKWILSAPIGK